MKTYIRRQQHKKIFKHQDIKRKEPPQKYRLGTISNTKLRIELGLTNERWDLHVSLVFTDNFSLTKIICHRNFRNEFAFTHSKDYLYYLARSPLSQIFDNETSPQS